MIPWLLSLAVHAGFGQGTPDHPSFEVKLGSWTSVLASGSEVLPPENGWAPARTPQLVEVHADGTRHALWYRSRVVVPNVRPGQRVFLSLRGALYAPTIFVDGKAVGAWFDGWNPDEVEITKAATPGSHEIAIQCHDMGINFVPGFVPTANESSWNGKVEGLLGGYKNQIGLWDDVLLRISGPERIVKDRLQISTSVRKSKIRVGGFSEIKGSGRKVRVVAIDAKGVSRLLGDAPVGADGYWQINPAFPKPRLWSPENPHLYRLEVQLFDPSGRVLDRVEEKFGFKELWTQGPDFYLNGVKRHLLATSSWPGLDFPDAAEIRRRVRWVKSTGAIAFRLHIGPWQEEFLRAADEEGLLMIPEAPAYTDGSGMYNYKGLGFWMHYREHLVGMIGRDRNHASVAMWSLGNEILFMGNQRYDAELPKKLGELAQLVKSVDPDRPVTFEADLDPGNAYDVIGLHYPHELPDQHAYPVITDWIDAGKLTEAAGGMLGNLRSNFRWDRRKPLYIGEYLWVPHGDYSPGTVFFGDDAYRNRAEQNVRAKAAAWVDQTIAYRRAGVSGLGPWTATDFGMVPGPKELADAQRYAYKPLAAYLRNRAVRGAPGSVVNLTFDVFNDLPREATIRLRIEASDGSPVRTAPVRLSPATRSVVKVAFRLPKREGKSRLRFAVLEDTKEVGTDSAWVETSAFVRFQSIAGRKVVYYDPSGKETGSVRTLAGLDPGATLLIVAPYAMDPVVPKEANGLPVIGGSRFDTSGFLTFLSAGGRAMVLEQNDLSAAGLGLSLKEHVSTMAYPLGPTFEPGSLKFWGAEMIVAKRQIVRSGVGGLRALAVTGGAQSLAQTPIALLPVGRGAVVFLQTTAQENVDTDPAVGRTLQKAAEIVCQAPAARGDSLLVVGGTPEVRARLERAGVRYREIEGALEPGDLADAAGVLLVGGGESVTRSASAIGEATKLRLPIVWHVATQDAFASLRGVLGASALAVDAGEGAPVISERTSPLLMGVANEDLRFTSPPVGWDRRIEMRTRTVKSVLVPISQGTAAAKEYPVRDAKIGRGAREGGTAVFDRRGTATFSVAVPKTGTYRLSLLADGRANGASNPVVEIRVDGESRDWLRIDSIGQSAKTLLMLPAGKHEIELEYVNGPEWGGPARLTVRGIRLGSALSYPAGVKMLAMPGAVASWSAGGSVVVFDGFAWEGDRENEAKAVRYIGALFANLGVPFVAPKAYGAQDVPTAGFKIEGGAYNEAGPGGVVLRSNGSASASLFVANAGAFVPSFVAESTSVAGEFARFEVEIDGRKVGSVVAASTSAQEYRLEPVQLGVGRHEIRLTFVNDASQGAEDRNLTVRGVRFGMV